MNENNGLSESCLKLKVLPLKQLKDGWMPGLISIFKNKNYDNWGKEFHNVMKNETV